MFFQWKVLTPGGSTTCNTVYQLKKERVEKILLCDKCRLAGKRCRKILWKIFQDLKQNLRDSNVTFQPAENSPIFLGCPLSNFETWHPFKVKERGSNSGKRLRGAPKSVERRVVQDLSLFGLTPLRGCFGLKDPPRSYRDSLLEFSVSGRYLSVYRILVYFVIETTAHEQLFTTCKWIGIP